MIEKTIYDALNTAMLTIPVYLEIPETPPAEYVLFEKTGSSAENQVQHATIAVQSISKQSLYRAAEINELAKAAMSALPNSCTNIFRTRLNSDYNFTDTKTKRYRYQAVFDITYQE